MTDCLLIKAFNLNFWSFMQLSGILLCLFSLLLELNVAPHLWHLNLPVCIILCSLKESSFKYCLGHSGHWRIFESVPSDGDDSPCRFGVNMSVTDGWIALFKGVVLSMSCFTSLGFAGTLADNLILWSLRQFSGFLLWRFSLFLSLNGASHLWHLYFPLCKFSWRIKDFLLLYCFGHSGHWNTGGEDSSLVVNVSAVDTKIGEVSNSG